MKLIICNTYSQFIIATQLKLTLLKNTDLDIMLSDRSANVDKIIQPLKNLNVFNDVFFMEDKRFVYQRSKINSLLDVYNFSLGSVSDLSIKKYDEIIFYNLSFYLYSINDYYDKIGHKTNWSMMEEGIFSYDTDFESGRRIKLIRKIRQIIGKNEISDKVKKYYCFFPELKNNIYGWEIVKIPSLSQTQPLLIDLFKSIFNVDFEVSEQKYIFFASSSGIDGRSYSDHDVVSKIIEHVGTENFLVKVHPRDTSKFYLNNGINVFKNSWVPWEIFQIVNSLDDRIFLTLDSGAFITVSAMLNSKVVGLFLLKDIETKDKHFSERKKNIEAMIDKLHSNEICENIKYGSYKSLRNKLNE